jgi:hypothetical protein
VYEDDCHGCLVLQWVEDFLKSDAILHHYQTC